MTTNINNRSLFGPAPSDAMVSCLVQISEILGLQDWRARRQRLQDLAIQGRTIGRMRFGYRLSRTRSNGRPVNSVETAPDIAQHITWAFRSFANGDVSFAELHEELNARLGDLGEQGSAISPTISRARLRRILRNRYYVGVVQFEEHEYPGRHQPLTTPQIYERVQALLAHSPSRSLIPPVGDD